MANRRSPRATRRRSSTAPPTSRSRPCFAPATPAPAAAWNQCSTGARQRGGHRDPMSRSRSAPTAAAPCRPSTNSVGRRLSVTPSN
ncbi:MAG: hypothetical protein AVDCRST_MAG19-2448 [uncultured Thermomicrobiales bacterium]|uniref:Uncharacterized protein n=1 Tax=uncultured Thermomicrobiales bacterium TaxID=1645740 RepID=A0A6J4V7S0_9BACT|nr:MAG: hypothetical protein AVDCRST_MAG19-2448 [uncultured Thermomicrobiales bacterium]